MEFHPVSDQRGDIPIAGSVYRIQSPDDFPLCQSIWSFQGMPGGSIVNQSLTMVGCSVNATRKRAPAEGNILVLFCGDLLRFGVDMAVAPRDRGPEFGRDERSFLLATVKDQCVVNT